MAGAPAPLETLYGYYATVFLPTVAHLSGGTQQQFASLMDHNVLPRFGDRRIGSITRQEWQTFFNELSVKPSTKRGYCTKLRQILRLAQEDGVIQEVPKIRIPKVIDTERESLTFLELATLIEASDAKLRPVLLLLSIGLRISEALGASTALIESGVLMVHQQRTYYVGLTEEMKTPQSRRRIPLPPSLERELREASLGLLICGDIAHHSVDHYLRKLSAQTGIQVTTHIFRHTFVSLMENELEAPDRIRRDLVGHGAKGVHQRYSHTHMTQLRRWMDRYWGEVEACRRSVGQSSVLQRAK